jgi:predicted nucleic acid-binding protein
VIVLDASALVELLRGTTKGDRIDERIARDGGPYLAPHLVDLEVLHAFRELVRFGDVELDRAVAALSTFARFPLERLPHDVLRDRVWELRENLTAYDAAYVAVAEDFRCPLVTCDGPLKRAPGNRATIELF